MYNTLCSSVLLLQTLLHTVLGNPSFTDETRGSYCKANGFTWYLNGVQQDVGAGAEPPFLLPVAPGSRSMLTLEESAGENCTKTENRAQELLSIHFPQDSPVKAPHVSGLSLLLLLVIKTQPPSSFTIRDQDGQQLINSSRLILMDTRSVDGNGSLRVRISTEQRGVSKAPVTAMGILSSRVELSLLVLVLVSSSLAAGIILINILICCIVLKRRNKYGVVNNMTLSTSNNMKLNNSCIPREHMSLPSNLQLNDLRPQAKGPNDSACDTQEDVSVACAVLNDTGIDRFPLVGYIYRASSVSSDEIWL